MLVKLKRDVYMGEMLYKSRSHGTVFPDTVDGKPVVEHSDPRTNEEVCRLPRDAVILDKPVPVKSAAPVPQALSEMGAAKPKSFKKAMEEIDED